MAWYAFHSSKSCTLSICHNPQSKKYHNLEGDFLQYLEQFTCCCDIVILVHIMDSTHLYGCGLTINVRWPLCCVAMERVLCWVAIEWVVQLVEGIGRWWCLRNTCGYDS